MSFMGRVLLLAGLGAAMVAAQTQTANDVPEAAQKAMAAGAKYERDRQYPGAMDSYSLAAKQAGGHCASCLAALMRVQLKMDLLHDAEATIKRMSAMAPDAKSRAQSEWLGAQVFYSLYFGQSEGRGGDEKNPRKAAASLKEAEAMAARAESDDPASEPIRMLHARVLAAMQRDADATREFTACAAAPGVSAEECTRARHLATNVEIARKEPAPSFELKTIDGSPVSLDALAGKVVLIDFWATWCSACRSDAGYIQSTADMFGKDRFVLLEVSADDSRNTWQSYVREHHMQGVNAWDDQHTVADMFHVVGYPTYVILDGDGVMRMRALGTEGDLKGTVRKLLAEQTDTGKAPGGTAAGTGR